MGEEKSQRKPLFWVGSTKRDLKKFPDEVQDVMGYALHLAQCGEKHESTTVLRGFGGAGVLEVVEDFDGSTYRAVYTVKFKGVVYALHAFQKKSKKGVKTPKKEIDLVKQRLRAATEDYRTRERGR